MTDQLPQRLPKRCLLTVFNCPALTIGERIVWWRDWDLDLTAKRTYASPEHLSQFMAGYMKPKAVLQARGRLKRVGLHASERRKGYTNLVWVSTLPAEFIGRDDKHAASLGASLSAFIEEREAWLDRTVGERPPREEPDTGMVTVAPPDIRHWDARISGGGQAQPRGEGGSTQPSGTMSETQLFSQLRDSTMKKGVVAHATGTEGGVNPADLQRRPGEPTESYLTRIAELCRVATPGRHAV